MIYKIYTNNGERYSIEADYFVSDGSGISVFKNDGGVVAAFFPGEVVRIFPESTIVEAQTEVISENE